MKDNLNKYSERKKTILGMLLGGLFIISFLASITVSISYIADIFQLHQHTGVNPLIVITFTVGFLTLIKLSRLGYSKISAYLFIVLLVLVGVVNSLLWGADVPIAFLFFTIAIVISGILVQANTSIYIALIILVLLTSIAYLQSIELLSYDNYWISNSPTTVDGFFAGISFSIIALVAWLSNREIEKSLSRARISEKKLRQERDLLEVRVEERTKQLQQSQKDYLENVQIFADFGKLTSGLIHEIVNPLTVVSLNLDQMISDKRRNSDISNALKRAIDNTRRIENYIQLARKQIQKQKVIEEFDIRKEIDDVVTLLSYKMKACGVTLDVISPESLSYYGNSIQFSQCICNIIDNAIDAVKADRENSKITIHVIQEADYITIAVKDNGQGIDQKDLEHIFQPFYSTKKARGTGIGLSHTRDAIETEFNGSIEAFSDLNGTEMIITLPVSSSLVIS